jgi:hypothetical protein
MNVLDSLRSDKVQTRQGVIFKIDSKDPLSVIQEWDLPSYNCILTKKELVAQYVTFRFQCVKCDQKYRSFKASWKRPGLLRILATSVLGIWPQPFLNLNIYKDCDVVGGCFMYPWGLPIHASSYVLYTM